jgi:hypothetical protein
MHQSLQVSPQPNIQRIKVRRSCRPVDWASAPYPPFTESLVQVLSDSAEKMRWCPIMHGPRVLSLMKRHMFQEYTTIRWYTAPVSLLGNTTGPKDRSPKMPTQIMTRPYLSRHWFLDIRLTGLLCLFECLTPLTLSKGCHLDVVRGPSTPHDPESDAGGSLSSWQGHPSR